MNEVEKVRQICKERKIPISRLEKECGFANGYIGQLKKGVFPSDRLIKIADYLNLPLSALSQAASEIQTTDYIYRLDNGHKILIEVHPVIKDVMSGPYKDRLITYAQKLKELQHMEEEASLSTDKSDTDTV